MDWIEEQPPPPPSNYKMVLPSGWSLRVEFDACASDYQWFWTVRDPEGDIPKNTGIHYSYGWESDEETAKSKAVQWAKDYGIWNPANPDPS